MAGKKLTDPYIRALPAPAKRMEIADTLVTGLYLAVEPTGTKVFVHRYTHQGKGIRHALKPRYPALSLADARRMVQGQRVTLASGGDPRAQAASKSTRHTMKSLCILYLESRMKCTKKITWRNYAHQLGLTHQEDGSWALSKSSILAQWDGRTPESLTKDELKNAFEKITATRGVSMADHIFATLSRLFRWADRQDLPTNLLMAKIEAPMLRKTKRQRLLTSQELAAIWNAALSLAPDCEVYDPERDILHWLILTGQRISQATFLEFTDLDFTEGIWRIPGDKPGSKGVPNFLPITDGMAAIIGRCPHRTGYLFSRDGGHTPFKLHNVTKDKLDGILARQGYGIERWTYHDFRRIYRTALSSFPIPHGDKVCELLLGHTLPGVVPIYNLYAHLPEKRIGLDSWAAFVAKALAAANQTRLEHLAA